MSEKSFPQSARTKKTNLLKMYDSSFSFFILAVDCFHPSELSGCSSVASFFRTLFSFALFDLPISKEIRKPIAREMGIYTGWTVPFGILSPSYGSPVCAWVRNLSQQSAKSLKASPYHLHISQGIYHNVGGKRILESGNKVNSNFLLT